jgi:hypothetical protein
MILDLGRRRRASLCIDREVRGAREERRAHAPILDVLASATVARLAADADLEELLAGEVASSEADDALETALFRASFERAPEPGGFAGEPVT